MNAKRAKEWLRRLETLPEMQEVDVATRGS